MPVALQDKVVIVVGASSGIGRATACLLAGEGARVMAAARREDRLIELRDESRNAGRPIEIHVCDVTKATHMDGLVAQTLERLGRVDFLVYVSGTNVPNRAMSILDAEMLENRPVKPSPEMLSHALQPQDVAEMILAVARLPERAVVPELHLLPTYL